jgi:hypothetical protein
MARQIRFQKCKKMSNLREVIVDNVVIGAAMIQDPRDGYRGLGARRIVFDPFNNSWAWGGQQRIFPNLSALRDWLQAYSYGPSPRRNRVEIYDRKTKKVIEVMDVTDSNEDQVLAGVRQKLAPEYAARIVGEG